MGLSKQQITMVAVLLSGALMVVLNATLLSPAFPAIMRDMAVDATTVQWLTSGYAMIEAVVIPLSAWCIGKFRTRQLFLTGLLVFTVGSLIACLAPVFPILLLGRVLQASSAGIVMPMVFTLIMLIFPREKRGAGMGLVTLIIGFAPAIGPCVSGLLVDSVGWRAIFGIVTVITLIVVLVAAKALEDFEGFKPASLDVPSVIMSCLGMLALLYGLSSFASSENIALPAALIIIGLVTLGCFVYRQLNLEEPLLRVDVLKSVRYRITFIVVALFQAAFVGTTVIYPLYIQNTLGLSATVTGLIMLPGAILGAITGMIAGRLFDRFGVRGLAVTGATMLLIGAAGMALLSINSTVAIVLIVMTLVSLSMQLIITPINTWGINSLDNSVIQHANALSNTMNQVGASFGTAVIVSLSAFAPALYPNATGAELQYYGYHISLVGSGLILVVIFFIILVFVRNKIGANAPAYGTHHTREKQPVSQRGFQVQDVMVSDIFVLSDKSTVRDALKIFGETKTSGIPIVDSRNKAVGFVSDGDLMKYIGTTDESFANPAVALYTIVEDQTIQQRVATMLDMNIMRIATNHIVGVPSTMALDKACGILAERKIKMLPVIDDSQKVVGMLSRRNIIQAINESLNTQPAGSSAR